VARAERARLAVAQLRTGPADERPLSASFGVAVIGSDLTRAHAEADAALYRAKREGRNRVVGA
jgi:GGDEF domain-containing protein